MSTARGKRARDSDSDADSNSSDDSDTTNAARNRHGTDGRGRGPAGKRRGAKAAEEDSAADDDYSDEAAMNAALAQGEEAAAQEELHDFEFFDPRPEDYFYVRTLLANYLGRAPFHAGDLADLIAQQVSVGSMIKIDGQSDIYGFITALNVYQHRALQSMQHIRAFVLQQCPQDKAAAFTAVFDDPTTGLLVNERVVNLPHQVGPPLLQNLVEDIEWAQQNEEDEISRRGFCFSRFIYLAPMYEELTSGDAQAPSGGGKRTKGEAFFIKPEDELLSKAAQLAFTCPMPRNAKNVKSLFECQVKQMGMIMVIPANVLSHVATELLMSQC